MRSGWLTPRDFSVITHFRDQVFDHIVRWLRWLKTDLPLGVPCVQLNLLDGFGSNLPDRGRLVIRHNDLGFLECHFLFMLKDHIFSQLLIHWFLLWDKWLNLLAIQGYLFHQLSLLVVQHLLLEDLPGQVCLVSRVLMVEVSRGVVHSLGGIRHARSFPLL